jgi:hypothetical protein
MFVTVLTETRVDRKRVYRGLPVQWKSAVYIRGRKMWADRHNGVFFQRIRRRECIINDKYKKFLS